MNGGINYLEAGAGFLPSTVCEHQFGESGFEMAGVNKIPEP